MRLFKISNRHKSFDLLIFFQLQQIDDCFTASQPSHIGNAMHFQPVAFSVIGEEEDIGMCGNHKNTLCEIIFFQVRTGKTFTTAALFSVSIDGKSFNVTAVRDRDHHIFIGDHIFSINIGIPFQDNCAAQIAVFFFDLQRLFLDDIHSFLAVFQNTFQFYYQFYKFVVFLLNLFSFQPGQFLQSHFQNCFGLNFR